MADESSSSQIDVLKNKISLSNSELYELAYNHQKFMHTVRKFNNEAKNKIDFQMPQEALVFLAEAERVLEYAASCGKNIDRNLIICVLHNEACCYQKSWDLEKCSNYLQALIYNFQSTSDSIHTSPRSNDSRFKENSQSLFPEEVPVNELMKKPWLHRLHLCKYELQFCAINSQLRNHRSALISGRKSIAFIKSIFKQLQKIGQEYFMPLGERESMQETLMEQPFEDFQTKMRIIQGICSIDDTPETGRLEDYLITAKYYLNKWNIRKLENRNEVLKQSFRNFSIGSVMQLKPLSFEENRQSTIDIEKWLENAYEERSQTQLLKSETYEKILNKVLLLSMSYFTIATEMRLLSNQKYRKSEQVKRQSRQYKQSQIYHLISVIIACIYVPYDMLYMRHILASFNNHYPISIDSNFAVASEDQVMKDCFDRLRLSDEKEGKKNNTKLLYSDFEKSIRISSEDILQDMSTRKQKEKKKKDSKGKKLTKSKKKESRPKSNQNSLTKNKQLGGKNKSKSKRVKSDLQDPQHKLRNIKSKDTAKQSRQKSAVTSKMISNMKESQKLLEGNEYFECRKKGLEGKKGKSKDKRREKSKDKPVPFKKNIDKYYF